jgi:hypothetical protein
MFIYCFDEQERDRLQNLFKLHQESNIDNKKCWIFIMDKNKINFDQIDKSKCYITNKLVF